MSSEWGEVWIIITLWSHNVFYNHTMYWMENIKEQGWDCGSAILKTLRKLFELFRL